MSTTTPKKAVKAPKSVYVGSHHNTRSISVIQGQELIPTITREKCGSDALSACTVVMAPGKVAKMHVHEHNDIIVIVVEGHAATLIGEDLEPVYHGQGEFIYIPAGVPHTAVNVSTKHRVVAFEVRTDPHFNEDVVLLPHLEKKAAEKAAYIHKHFHTGKLALPKHWDATDVGPFKFPELVEE
jgi:uncharacterized RmlC-like cupin family protein